MKRHSLAALTSVHEVVQREKCYMAEAGKLIGTVDGSNRETCSELMSWLTLFSIDSLADAAHANACNATLMSKCSHLQQSTCI